MINTYQDLKENIQALPYKDISRVHSDYVQAINDVEAILDDCKSHLIRYSHITSSWLIKEGSGFFELWNNHVYTLEESLLRDAGLWDFMDELNG